MDSTTDGDYLLRTVIAVMEDFRMAETNTQPVHSSSVTTAKNNRQIN
ncbi:MAG: hypothetical protein AB8B97_17610 [Granulosicoccus sp.]